MRPTLLIILTLLATGCSASDPRDPPQVERGGAVARAQVQGDAAQAQASSSGAKAIARSDELIEFKLSYPAEVGAIPALARRIEQEALAAEAEMRVQARDAQAAAKEAGSSFNGHYLSQEWEVIADLPRFLSLSNSFATYTGGAHGMYGMDALIWDRETGRPLEAKDLFVPSAALQEALAGRFCRALDRERQKRRGGDGKIGGEFDECPALDGVVVLLGSSNKRTFDRMTLYAGPYVAGPYAEGAYEVDLSIDAAMLATVKPEYRAYFSAGG